MSQNEERADRGMRIINTYSDKNYDYPGELVDGMRLDITDVMADLLHLADRYGLDHGDIIEKMRNSYVGDMEDGPRVKEII